MFTKTWCAETLFFQTAISLALLFHGLPCRATEQSEKILNYADQLFVDQEFYRAITEYRRFIAYFPEEEKIDEIYLKICNCYYLGERYFDAINWAKKTLAKSSKPSILAQGNLIAGDSYFALGNYSAAQNFYSAVLSIEDLDLDWSDRARLKLGICALREEKWLKASREFASIKSDSQYFRKSQLFSQKALEGNDLPHKSLWLAGALSLIPGAGYYYAGNKGTALASFIVNSLFIWGTCEAFNKEEKAVGAVIGLFAFGLYSGNIYGSIGSAARYNEQQKEKFWAEFDF